MESIKTFCWVFFPTRVSQDKHCVSYLCLLYLSVDLFNVNCKRTLTCRKSNTKKYSHSHDFPLLKLDVKFYFPIYDGELNEKNMDNWIKQIELYLRVQRIIDETTKL